jgi:pectate lyase
LPAFPGAEGFGSETPGGRGGKVIQVTNTKDSGPGSLREAVNAKGPRIVVFRVSGTIDMGSDLVIKNPNITIAGQTAPGGGICLKGRGFYISTRDAVVRYLRIRRGTGNADALAIGGAENIIVDHCSVSWGTDETINTWHGSKNITIQWTIISEALHHRNHGFAASLGGVNASYHHMLLANCPGRNPSVAGNSEHPTINMDWRNNVIYNWGHRTCDGNPNSINVVNNYYKPGPNQQLDLFVRLQGGKWYVSGNVWEGKPERSQDNHAFVGGNKDMLVNTPFPTAPIKPCTAEEAYKMVLADVGASMPSRDSHDTRIIKEATTGIPTYGKGICLNPADVGGWPELKSTEPPADSDADGMADAWETEKGLNPNDASDGPKDRDGDGYTNVEEYINGLIMDPLAPTALNSGTPFSSQPKVHGLTIEVHGGAVGRVLRANGGDGAESYEIFGRNGRLLLQGEMRNGCGHFNAELLPSGAYFFRMGNLVKTWINLGK